MRIGDASVAALMKEAPALPPEKLGSWAKDHCDHLLDSIDAQLSWLQDQGPDLDIKSCSSCRMASLDRTAGSSVAADLRLGGSGGRNSDAPLGEDSPFWKEENAWGLLARLSDLEGPAGGQSESDSVCTEDFAARFQEGLVDPCLSSRGEENAVAAGVLSCDFGPLGGTTIHSQVVPSRFLEGLEAAAGSHSVDLESRQGVAQLLQEALREVRDPVFMGEPLPWSVWDRIGSSESLGGKIPQPRQKCCKETDNAIESSAWILWPGRSEEKVLEIGAQGHARASLESPQRREAADLSVGRIQDAWGDSNSPLLMEDLGPSQLHQVPRMTIADAEVPLRAGAQKGQSDCPKDVPGIACVCSLQAPQNCVPCSAGEARGGRCCIYSTIAGDANQSPKLAPPEPATHTCVAGAPGGAKEPLDPGSECGRKPRTSWATKAAGTRRSDGAPGLMECGRLGAECSEPQHRLNKGPPECVGDRWVAGIPVKSFDDVTIDSDLDSVRTESVRGHFSRALGCQQAHGTRKFCSPQRSLLRDPGSSDADTDQEEEQDGLGKFWRRSRPKKWTQGREADPGRKGAKKGAFRICKSKPMVGKIYEDSFSDFASQNLDVGEEKLLQEKAMIHEANVSLRSLLQQKEQVALELKTLQGLTLEESQKEARRLERHVEENRKKVDEARADLLLLEYKREACLRELPRAEEELRVLRRQSGALRTKVSQLATEREALKTQVRHLEDNLSSLKLQLRGCQAEQETAEARTSQLQEVAQVASELDGRIQGLELRVSALQKALSEKELALSRLRETNSALEAEKEAQASVVEGLKQERSRQLQELQQRKVAESAARAKADALQEQASTYQKDIEDLRKTIEARDAELAQQKQDMRQREQDLKQESKEVVQNSLLQEKKKWEEDARAALQVQREALEGQHLRRRAELQEALEKERTAGLALQDRMADLCKRSQELESQICSQQREKQAAMEELRAQLQAEKAEGLRKLQEELEQERKREREQMRMRLQQVEEDLQALQVKQSRAAFRGQESHAHLGQADHSLAREVALVCQRLQDLLPKKAAVPSLSWTLHGSPGLLSSSRAVQALQDVSEEIQQYLLDLRQQMETQKQHLLQAEAEKELELRRLQEQLRLESQSALKTLKERLVQEHMNDISTLQRNQATADLALHQQLQEKDYELRAIRGNMGHWKEETARKLSHKFKEELERRLSRDKQTEVCRNSETPQVEMRPVAVDGSRYHRSLLTAAPLASRYSFSTPKLPLPLQNHVREPKAEKAGYYHRGSLDDLSRFGGDLGHTCPSRKQPPSMLSSSLLQSKGGKK